MTWDRFSKDGSMGILSESKTVEELKEKGKVLLETYAKIQSKKLRSHFNKAVALKGIDLDS